VSWGDETDWKWVDLRVEGEEMVLLLIAKDRIWYEYRYRSGPHGTVLPVGERAGRGSGPGR